MILKSPGRCAPDIHEAYMYKILHIVKVTVMYLADMFQS